MSEIQLYDLRKRGTVIVGAPRSGSHYIQDVIRAQLGIKNISFVNHDQVWGKNIYQEFNTGTGKYHICIANDLISKTFLMGQANLFKEWHVIRLTRSDITNWAVSCYFMLQDNSFGDQVTDNPKFKHNDTERSVYQEHLIQRPEYPIDSLVYFLSERSQTYDVPHHVCVDYADLATFFQHVWPWRPNDYPEIVWERDFKNGALVRQMLEAHTKIEQAYPSF
jgi:hypothetical protein